jgi:signal recognition particle receptor subunit beta
MQPDTIVSKTTGKAIKVIDFRRRTVFAEEDKLIRTTKFDEELRADLMARRALNDEYKIEYLVDVNETDLFSIGPNEKMFFPNPNLV